MFAVLRAGCLVGISLIGVRFQLITHGLCVVCQGLGQGADDVDQVLRLPALGLGVGLAAVAVNAVVLIWKLARIDFLTLRGSCGLRRSLQIKICLAHPVAQGSRVDRALGALLWVRRNGVRGCSQCCEHAAAALIAVKNEQPHVGPGGVWRAVYQCHETAQGALAAGLLIDGLNVLVQVGRVGIQLPRFSAPVNSAGAGL